MQTTISERKTPKIQRFASLLFYPIAGVTALLSAYYFYEKILWQITNDGRYYFAFQPIELNTFVLIALTICLIPVKGKTLTQLAYARLQRWTLKYQKVRIFEIGLFVYLVYSFILSVIWDYAENVHANVNLELVRQVASLDSATGTSNFLGLINGDQAVRDFPIVLGMALIVLLIQRADDFEKRFANTGIFLFALAFSFEIGSYILNPDWRNVHLGDNFIAAYITNVQFLIFSAFALGFFSLLRIIPIRWMRVLEG